MKVYISGKISGCDLGEARAKFARAARIVEACGHEAINPFNNGLAEDAPYREHLAADIRLLLGCDSIYMIGDWECSTGARIEACIAFELGMCIMHETSYILCQSRL